MKVYKALIHYSNKGVGGTTKAVFFNAVDEGELKKKVEKYIHDTLPYWSGNYYSATCEWSGELSPEQIVNTLNFMSHGG